METRQTSGADVTVPVYPASVRPGRWSLSVMTLTAWPAEGQTHKDAPDARHAQSNSKVEICYRLVEPPQTLIVSLDL